MLQENGNISIHTENIFPIIKKWLYSEKDIFVREMISNSSDAISKLKKLVTIGEAQIEEEKYKIDVMVNKTNKTIRVSDNGIGMTAEEVKKYINQIAFSGAKDFVEKYKDKTDDGQIIGHFGLGFYSVFMAADKVHIDTLSYQKGAEPVRWISAGGTEYSLEPSDRKERGTTVTLFISSDSEEYLDVYKLREVLTKYCEFMPYEIYLTDEEAKKEEKKEGEEEKAPTPINDTNPLWLKNPKDCTDEEYKEFYRKVFFDFNEPLFWIHLNMDYPFNLKGILYFPKLKHEFQGNEGQIKLFNNQVFVADNIKEVIPEFLLLLKGTIDCPDLPLNVSRSFLQNDGYVKKISTHITKKVADKLISIYENERDNYNKYWDDINPFIKYGCIREDKFYDRVKDIVIYKTINGEYVTLKDYLEKNKEKHENKVFYVTDERQQAQYIKMFKDHGFDAVILNNIIDGHFVQFLEMKDSTVKFARIDADISDLLKGNDEDADELKKMSEEMEKLFRTILDKQELKVEVKSLMTNTIPGMISISEQSMRMQEMSKYLGMDMPTLPIEETLVLNSNNNLIKQLKSLNESGSREEDVKLITEHIYDLAVMSHRPLESDAMTKFIERSNLIMEKMTM
jgi:molecular chaperone HtpG